MKLNCQSYFLYGGKNIMSILMAKVNKDHSLTLGSDTVATNSSTGYYENVGCKWVILPSEDDVKSMAVGCAGDYRVLQKARELTNLADFKLFFECAINETRYEGILVVICQGEEDYEWECRQYEFGYALPEKTILTSEVGCNTSFWGSCASALTHFYNGTLIYGDGLDSSLDVYMEYAQDFSNIRGKSFKYVEYEQ